jgi:hypothetical protein
VWETIPQVPELLMDGTNAYIYDGGTAPAEQVSLSAGTIRRALWYRGGGVTW